MSEVIADYAPHIHPTSLLCQCLNVQIIQTDEYAHQNRIYSEEDRPHITNHHITIPSDTLAEVVHHFPIPVPPSPLFPRLPTMSSTQQITPEVVTVHRFLMQNDHLVSIKPILLPQIIFNDYTPHSPSVASVVSPQATHSPPPPPEQQPPATPWFLVSCQHCQQNVCFINGFSRVVITNPYLLSMANETHRVAVMNLFQNEQVSRAYQMVLPNQPTNLHKVAEYFQGIGHSLDIFRPSEPVSHYSTKRKRPSPRQRSDSVDPSVALKKQRSPQNSQDDHNNKNHNNGMEMPTVDRKTLLTCPLDPHFESAFNVLLSATTSLPQQLTDDLQGEVLAGLPPPPPLHPLAVQVLNNGKPSTQAGSNRIPSTYPNIPSPHQHPSGQPSTLFTSLSTSSVKKDVLHLLHAQNQLDHHNTFNSEDFVLFLRLAVLFANTSYAQNVMDSKHLLQSFATASTRSEKQSTRDFIIQHIRMFQAVAYPPGPESIPSQPFFLYYSAPLVDIRVPYESQDEAVKHPENTPTPLVFHTGSAVEVFLREFSFLWGNHPELYVTTSQALGFPITIDGPTHPDHLGFIPLNASIQVKHGARHGVQISLAQLAPTNGASGVNPQHLDHDMNTDVEVTPLPDVVLKPLASPSGRERDGLRLKPSSLSPSPHSSQPTRRSPSQKPPSNHRHVSGTTSSHQHEDAYELTFGLDDDHEDIPAFDGVGERNPQTGLENIDECDEDEASRHQQEGFSHHRYTIVEDDTESIPHGYSDADYQPTDNSQPSSSSNVRVSGTTKPSSQDKDAFIHGGMSVPIPIQLSHSMATPALPPPPQVAQLEADTTSDQEMETILKYVEPAHDIVDPMALHSTNAHLLDPLDDDGDDSLAGHEEDHHSMDDDIDEDEVDDQIGPLTTDLTSHTHQSKPSSRQPKPHRDVLIVGSVHNFKLATAASSLGVVGPDGMTHNTEKTNLDTFQITIEPVKHQQQQENDSNNDNYDDDDNNPYHTQVGSLLTQSLRLGRDRV